jgi:hypothetical protein
MKNNTGKLTERDTARIKARYLAKFDEFDLLSLDELKEVHKTKKMSSTDRYALVNVVQKKLEVQIQEEQKELFKSEIKQINDETIKGEGDE